MSDDGNGVGVPAAAGRSLLASCGMAALLSVAASAVWAQEDCSFFSGKTVELIVPFNPGGGFDLYGRLLAAHMGSALGAENMIVRNQPGAGGLLATNQTWNLPPDGLTIQLMNVSGMLSSELGGAAGVGYETAGFSWIGRMTAEPDVISVPVDSPIQTFDDIRALAAERSVRIGSTGVGDADYIAAQIMGLVLGSEVDVILGFAGAAEVYSSLSRGELDMFSSSYGSAGRAQAAGSSRIIMLFADAPDPNFPDLSALGQFIEGDALELVSAFADVGFGSRSIGGPPGMAEGRLQCLRDAFDATMADPEFLAQTAERNLPVAPVSGAELSEVITNLMANPPEAYVALLRESFQN
jgi:tripartite-type tricarboxylate transporter receptor subunit TctC